MLIKEYRLLLPMTLEEYQVAQLYMVAKSSGEETSKTAGEGIVIHTNEPYTPDNNPYGLPPGGQYTHKTLHFASRLPRWLFSILPTTATMLTEQSWNAYPSCVTQYTNAYLGDALHLTVTSAHAADRGTQPNATGLGAADLAVRQVDYINIACGADADAAAARAYVSGTGGGRAAAAGVRRGPLRPRWFAEGDGGGVCMCAYKVVKLRFKVFGLQTRAESWGHYYGFRAAFAGYHRKLWMWLDEWWGLSVADVRAMEEETRRRNDAAMAAAAAAVGP
ncbi:hypothetical protein BU14_2761s0001 [Porphyra umbilicalis]|uniref:Phosphatidylinositol transfer protein N-terminal domain-containing protein n=1 Tax=Porphyra umbilicalis TaxID=2786 RepID=A0A1X6NIK7_PORUM|nr:hypothetical protein BU14_2761s0001 [Porphyra umbilicalis]|eukprot:OSX68461.1 hypothetical protein BU14_2761s0001 [Porphyra umbilicalis]